MQETKTHSGVKSDTEGPDSDTDDVTSASDTEGERGDCAK